jgi:hypothetical protein
MAERFRICGRSLAVIAVVLSVAGGEALAQNSRDELPIPASPQEDLTAIQRTFKPPPPPPLTLFPKARDQLQDLPPFLRDSKVGLDPRSYYRDVVTSSPGDKVTVKEAWAAGGSVSFETGRLFDVISGGAVFYTSLPLYAPLPYDGTDLLLPGQLGYDVVGQLYGQVHFTDNLHFTAGRYLYDTPYLGPNDTRMTPNTFYGYTLIGGTDERATGPSFRYGAGYIAAIKLRNTNVFQSMSRAAGANVDNGVGVIGGLMNWGPAYIGAVEYYCQDTLNIAYIEGKYGHKFSPDISAILAVQYADQRSTGANLTNGGAYFQTNQFGSTLDLGYQTGILTLGYSVVNPNFQMQNPWSSNPAYTNAMIQSFQRAGENALVVGASYVFTPIGLPGIAASVFFYQGWTGAAAGPPTVENEWDFEIDWRPNFKPFSGLWLRARYGTSLVNQNNKLTTTDEVRVILNYSVKLY